MGVWGVCGGGVQRPLHSYKGESKREATLDKRPQGTFELRMHRQSQLLSTEKSPLSQGSGAPSQQRQKGTSRAPPPRALAQPEGVGRDRCSDHQQRPLQSRGETRTTKARRRRGRGRGGTDESRGAKASTPRGRRPGGAEETRGGGGRGNPRAQ